MEDDVRQVRMDDVKGQLLMVVAEVGTEDTGSDGYRRSNKEGGRKEGVWIQLEQW